MSSMTSRYAAVNL